MTEKRRKELISKTKTLFIYRFRRTIIEAEQDGATEEDILKILQKCFPKSVSDETILELYKWFKSGSCTKVFNSYERRLTPEFRTKRTKTNS